MKNITIFLLLIALVSFNTKDFKNNDIVCSEITVKNSSYETKNIYIYGTKPGSDPWLAASFGLAKGKSTAVDTSGQYGTTWKVYAKGQYGQRSEVYGSCDFTIY